MKQPEKWKLELDLEEIKRTVETPNSEAMPSKCHDQFVCSFRGKIGVVTYQDRLSSEFGKVLTIQPFIYELTICKHLKKNKKKNNFAFF